MNDVIIITLFKTTVIIAFTIGLNFWYKESKKIYVAYLYWFLGLFFMFLNVHGVLNGLTQLLTGDYLMFNVPNLIAAFIIYAGVGKKYFSAI